MRAVDAVAAGAAEGQRRIAAAVEEQQGLLARARGSRRWPSRSARRQPAAASPAGRAQVDELDLRHRGAAVAGGQVQPAVAAGSALRRVSSDGVAEASTSGICAELGADHGQVAGVVDDAVLLLEGRRRAPRRRRSGARSANGRNSAERAPTTTCAPVRRPPARRGGAAGRPRSECQRAGVGAEAVVEAREPLGAERDLRQQHQHLPARPRERRGDRLEIDLGLARAGDAVEQRHRVAAAHGLAQPLAPPPPARATAPGRRVRTARRFVGAAAPSPTMTGTISPASASALTTPAADAGLLRKLAGRSRPAVGEHRQHPLARRRQSLGGARPRQGDVRRDAARRRAQRLRHAHHHPEHRRPADGRCSRATQSTNRRISADSGGTGEALRESAAAFAAGRRRCPVPQMTPASRRGPSGTSTKAPSSTAKRLRGAGGTR